jgi:hypothetical protein
METRGTFCVKIGPLGDLAYADIAGDDQDGKTQGSAEILRAG